MTSQCNDDKGDKDDDSNDEFRIKNKEKKGVR